MNTHFTVREYWFTPQNPLKVEELPYLANKIENAYKTQAGEKVHVFAKPIFKTSFAGYTGQGSDSKWEIRLIVAHSKENGTKLAQPNSGGENSANLPNELFIQIPNRDSQNATVTLREDKRLEVDVTSKIASLISVIEKTKKLVVSSRRCLDPAEAEAIERKLNKLIVYILKTLNNSPPLWPYKEPQSIDKPSSIDKIKDKFTKFNTHFDPKHYITVNYQTAFSSYLSTLNRDFQETAMTIEEISWKITSKNKRLPQPGSGFFERIQWLLEIGVQSIDENCKESQKSELTCFLHALKENAHTYRSDADFVSSKREFQKVVDDIIERIMYFDSQLGTTVLCDFCLSLFKEIQAYRETNIGSPSLFSVSRMLEALLDHQPKGEQEPFIFYMRRQRDNVTPELQKMIVDLFFPTQQQEESSVWRPVADFIVGLGDKNLFNALIEKGIRQADSITRNQIDYIFDCLNRYLSEEKGTLKKNYTEMFNNLLAKLADLNKLHFLKPFARQTKNQRRLRANLEDRGGLDYGFMKDIELSSFFGNATFKALEAARTEKLLSKPTEGLQRTLVRLFRGCGNNRVGNDATFISELNKFVKDYLEGYEDLFVLILGQLGDMSESRDFNILVEDWIATTLTELYRSIKNFVIRSIPIEWKQQDLDKLSEEDLCFHEDKFYVVRKRGDGTLALKEWLTGNAPSQTPAKILATEGLGAIKGRLRAHLSENSGSPRQQISALAGAYFLSNAEKFKGILKIFETQSLEDMQKEGCTSETFEERLMAWVQFFNTISLFFNNLEPLVAEGLFNAGKVKMPVVSKLVAKHKDLIKKKEWSQESRRYDPFSNPANGQIDKSEEIVGALAQLVAPLCEEEVKQVLSGSGLSDLEKIAGQFDAVVRHKLGDYTFPKERVIEEFAKSPTNQGSYSNLHRQQDLKEAIGELEIKEQFYTDHKGALLACKPPINFVMPHQAIAAELCTSPSFRYLNGRSGAETNLLIKMGTGQGKSLVIATAALSEAKKFREKGEKGLVLVLTSYPHLAKRDQELGQSFFNNENLRSVCLSETKDVDSAFETDPHILYSDIASLQQIVRDVAMKVFSGNSKKAHKDFIKAMFSIGDWKLRMVLDEYVLLLDEYKAKWPLSDRTPDTLLNNSHLQTLRNYSKIGDVFALDNQNGIYKSPIAILYLLQLMQIAERIIGLSVTANYNTPEYNYVSEDLKNRVYFHIPSSKDPTKFETDYDRSVTNQANPSSIVCRKMIEGIGYYSIKDSNGQTNCVIGKNFLERYLTEIIDDVKAVQKEEKDRSKARPVLIFADPHLKFKRHRNDTEKARKLWDELKEALVRSGIAINPLSDKFLEDVTLSKEEKQQKNFVEITDTDLQSIACAGSVTIAPIKWAHGSDIRVNPHIEKGLHVLIATNLSDQTSLRLAVGRTGRMGHPGSYSAITLGKLFTPPITPPNQGFAFEGLVLFFESDFEVRHGVMKALHKLTKTFMERIIDSNGNNRDLCRKWLIFTAAAMLSSHWSKMNRAHVREICGVNDDDVNNLGTQYFV